MKQAFSVWLRAIAAQPQRVYANVKSLLRIMWYYKKGT